jgi:hypothetical protein
MMTPEHNDMAKLEAARKLVEQQYLDNPATADRMHTVYIGKVFNNKLETDELGVIVEVTDKIPEAYLAEADKVPRFVTINGEAIRVDVKEQPRPTDRRLVVPKELLSQNHQSPELRMELQSLLAQYDFLAQHTGGVAQAISEWRKCFDCPIPGGPQMAPDGAGWVGTLSCALRGQNSKGEMIVGAMTNYHVGVSAERVGIKMGQPTGTGNLAFATLETWSPMKFTSSANNRVDACFMATLRNGMYTVAPTQFKIGDIDPRPVLTHKIGDRVQKSGRTTGHMIGKVVGINATSHIGYGQGTARFTGQTICVGDSGDMSLPGDSGSLVLDMERRPYGLLFAGGGGQTIINTIKDVMEVMKVEFVGMDHFRQAA